MSFLELLILSCLQDSACICGRRNTRHAVIWEMSLCRHDSFKYVNLLIEMLVLVFLVSNFYSMRWHWYAFLQVLDLMELRYLSSYEALKRRQMCVEFENGWPVCIWSSIRWIHLRKIIWSDFNRTLLWLLKQWAADLVWEWLLLVLTHRWHRLIVCHYVVFADQFVSCNYWEFLIVHLKLLSLLYCLIRSEILLQCTVWSCLAFAWWFFIMNCKTVSNFHVCIETKLPRGKLMVCLKFWCHTRLLCILKIFLSHTLVGLLVSWFSFLNIIDVW